MSKHSESEEPEDSIKIRVVPVSEWSTQIVERWVKLAMTDPSLETDGVPLYEWLAAPSSKRGVKLSQIGQYPSKMTLTLS